jgi:phosphoserine phosphatase RsbU/P
MALVSILCTVKRRYLGGANMLTEMSPIGTGSEWADACEVQQRFLPRPAAPAEALDFSARCRQMLALGGDCYDFLPLDGDRLAMVVGDASGKGLAAALMISNVQSSVRTASLFAGDDGATAISAVNRQVHGSSLVDRYATLFYGVFDRATRKLRYVNAGHQPPMVLRRDGSIVWLEAGGAPVGIFADWTYEEASIALRPGDIVIACTDGAIEAVNPDGAEWGLEGLKKAALRSRAQSAGEMVHAIFGTMDEFSRGYQTDDATVAVLKVL